MSDNTLIYPYNDVRKMFETLYSCSISQFMKQIKPIIGYPSAGLKYTSTPFPVSAGTPTHLDDLSLNTTLIGLITTNLTAFILTKDTAQTFQRLIAWANKTNSDYIIETITLLIQRVKDLGDASLLSVAYLSYYEAHMYRTQLLTDENLVFPDANEAAVLLQLAKSAAAVLISCPGPHYRPILDGAYNNIVSRGGPDFMTDDAVWALRFRKGGPVINDTMYLLVTYVLVVQSDQYKDNPPRYLRVINPVESMVYSIDISTINPLLLRIIRDAIYGPDFANPTVSSLTASQQARLIITTIGLLDICHLGKDAITEHVRQSCPFQEETTNITQLREPVVRQFIGIHEHGETDERIKKAILALNHLYYYYDYPDAPVGIPVTLSDTLLADLLEKTLAY